MVSYVLVKDICKHEDYPCCGCSSEAYPMEESDARTLAKEHKVKILRKYRPTAYYGGCDDYY